MSNKTYLQNRLSCVNHTNHCHALISRVNIIVILFKTSVKVNVQELLRKKNIYFSKIKTFAVCLLYAYSYTFTLKLRVFSKFHVLFIYLYFLNYSSIPVFYLMNRCLKRPLYIWERYGIVSPSINLDNRLYLRIQLGDLQIFLTYFIDKFTMYNDDLKKTAFLHH